MNDVSKKLMQAAEGDDASAQALLPLVYEDLRKLAQSRMTHEAASHTLQPTALVHEAWLRLVDDNEKMWRNRAYFFAAASTAMRRILIDHARKKSHLKRGGNQQRVDIERVEISEPEPDEVLLKMDAALKELERIHADWARVVVMKHFGGMTNKETATAMEISEASVERYWAAAKVWLYRKMNAHD